MPFPLPKAKMQSSNQPAVTGGDPTVASTGSMIGQKSFNPTVPQNPGPTSKGPPSGFPPKHQPPGAAKALKKKPKSSTGKAIPNQFSLKGC